MTRNIHLINLDRCVPSISHAPNYNYHNCWHKNLRCCCTNTFLIFYGDFAFNHDGRVIRQQPSQSSYLRCRMSQDTPEMFSDESLTCWCPFVCVYSICGMSNFLSLSSRSWSDGGEGSSLALGANHSNSDDDLVLRWWGRSRGRLWEELAASEGTVSLERLHWGLCGGFAIRLQDTEGSYRLCSCFWDWLWLDRDLDDRRYKYLVGCESRTRIGEGGKRGRGWVKRI